jgi:hypothetical protein
MNKQGTYSRSYKSYSVVRYFIPKISWKGARQCVLASIKKFDADVAETWVC